MAGAQMPAACCSESSNDGDDEQHKDRGVFADKDASAGEDTESPEEGAERKEEPTRASSEKTDGVSLFAAPKNSTRSSQNIQHAVLPVVINGKKRLACLDTGAGKNYIAEAQLSDLERAAVQYTPSMGPIRHAGGGKMKLLGTLTTSLEVGGRNLGLVPFKVARGLPVEAILGNEFITRNVAAMYPRTQWIRFNGATAMIKYQVKSTEIENPLVRQPVQVRVLERKRLPAESVTPIRVRLDQVLSIPCMIKRNMRAFEIHGILPTQVILPPGVRDTTLLIGNFDRRAVDLFPRQCVAECEIEEMDQCRIVGALPEEARKAKNDELQKAGNSLDKKKHEQDVLQKIKSETEHLQAKQQEKLLKMLQVFKHSFWAKVRTNICSSA